MDHNSFLTVNELAKLLALNPQTIYRKCKRGQLCFTQIGRTIRFSPEQVFAIQNQGNQKKSTDKVINFKALPNSIKQLFWDIDISQLSANDRIVIERILDRGDLAELRWLQKYVSSKKVKEFIIDHGKKRLSEKSFNFWSLIFGINNEINDSSRNTKKTLGKTGWR